MAETKDIKEQSYINKQHLLTFTLDDQVKHATLVSNLCYSVGKELELEEDICRELFDAGQVHDIGKKDLATFIYEENNPLVVEEMKYVRMHPQLGYEILKERGYSKFILESIRHHHENMDGSGYPDNLSGEEIPYGARVVRVCDVFGALIADRPYRKAFSETAAIELMIDEIKNFDLKIFLALQRVVHEEKYKNVVFSK